MDICAEELHNSVLCTVAIQSDILAFLDKLNESLGTYKFKENSNWWKILNDKCAANKKAVEKMALDIAPPLNYYSVFHHIQQLIPNDAIIVSEGICSKYYLTCYCVKYEVLVSL